MNKFYDHKGDEKDPSYQKIQHPNPLSPFGTSTPPFKYNKKKESLLIRFLKLFILSPEQEYHFYKVWMSGIFYNMHKQNQKN